jgi:hypothetical protein
LKEALLGPVVSDLTRIGLGSDEVVIATGFYSAGPLVELVPMIGARSVVILTRLNLHSVEEWVRGSIAPDALLKFIDGLEGKGVSHSLWVSPNAHAKAYLGDNGFLVGSANLSTNALSGTADEILWFDNARDARQKARIALNEYRNQLDEVPTEDLRNYVLDNVDEVRERARRERRTAHDQGRQPGTVNQRPVRLGSYQGFLDWAQARGDAACREIVARAKGRHNLSGHIRRNFYGIRQLFLLHPSLAAYFRQLPTDRYSLVADPQAMASFREFVVSEARNEADLDVSSWKNYLPVNCGGRQVSGGATTGNLNRMLPLMARYFSRLAR